MPRHLIRPYEYKVYQKAQGEMTPRLAIELTQRFGLAEVERRMERQLRKDERFRRHVEAERAEAAARGVQVVVDETGPDHYTVVKQLA
jgi:2-hydroxychromene-2-carboxylate isomerase